MIKALLFDFSGVLLFPKDKSYHGALNVLNKKLRQNPNYNFLEYFELNNELMDYLMPLKSKIPVHMFTSGTIQESPEIKEDVDKIFARIFSASKMGVEKSDPESYRKIATEINCEPSEIFYTDDFGPNVEAAKSAGCNAVLYKDNPQIISELQKI
jgi:HAD superfamily hydrolase (TIGR01549 family)